MGGGWRLRPERVLDGQVVDHGFDAGDLGGVGGGERAGGFAADGAVEGGDAVLDGGLDGLGAEGAVAGDAALESGGEAGVVGRRCGRGALATGEARVSDESGDGGRCVAWRDFVWRTWIPFSCVVAQLFAANTVNHSTGI